MIKCRPLVIGCRSTGDFPCHLYSLRETLVLPSAKCWSTVNSQLFLFFPLPHSFSCPSWKKKKRFKESISGVNEIFIFRARNWQNKNDFYLGEHLCRFLWKTGDRGWRVGGRGGSGGGGCGLCAVSRTGNRLYIKGTVETVTPPSAAFTEPRLQYLPRPRALAPWQASLLLKDDFQLFKIIPVLNTPTRSSDRHSDKWSRVSNHTGFDSTDRWDLIEWECSLGF